MNLLIRIQKCYEVSEFYIKIGRLKFLFYTYTKLPTSLKDLIRILLEFSYQKICDLLKIKFLKTYSIIKEETVFISNPDI